MAAVEIHYVRNHHGGDTVRSELMSLYGLIHTTSGIQVRWKSIAR
jgi:hypothetical protein